MKFEVVQISDFLSILSFNFYLPLYFGNRWLFTYLSVFVKIGHLHSQIIPFRFLPARYPSVVPTLITLPDNWIIFQIKRAMNYSFASLGMTSYWIRRWLCMIKYGMCQVVHNHRQEVGELSVFFRYHFRYTAVFIQKVGQVWNVGLVHGMRLGAWGNLLSS